MEYELAIEGAPDSIPGGTAILLLHPSTGETDRIDTEFLKADTDHFLVISTRTTAREVRQKLEYYDVDESRADILDTLSVERGYSRRKSENIHYVSAPEDVDGILAKTEEFLATHEGKRRVSFDSITELAYYADDSAAVEALQRLGDLLDEHDAVGIFHVSEEVHDGAVLERFRAACDAVIDVQEDGTLTAEF
jgi:KaiC/GvpD/RAD55 family RecA-like ATPase